MVGGPAALLDPLGPLYATTPPPVPSALYGGVGAVVRSVLEGRLVLVPAVSVAAGRVAWVAEVAAGLAEVRGRYARLVRAGLVRQHHLAADRLLCGDPVLAAQVFGRGRLTGAVEVQRLTGTVDAVQAAATSLQRLVRGEREACLLVRGRRDVGVMAPRWPESPPVTAPGHGDRAVVRLVERTARQYGAALGWAESVPWPLVAAAWAEAAGGHDTRRGLGPIDLDHLLPPAATQAWAQRALAPLEEPARVVAEVWLRCGSATAAATATGASRTTVRDRIATLAPALGTALTPTIRAHLVLALRWARGPAASKTAPPGPEADPPAGAGEATTEVAAITVSPLTSCTSPTAAIHWAHALLPPLDDRERYALWAWLEHDAIAPAAADLGVHRGTLTTWLETAAERLGAPLSTARVRAQVRIALEATGGPRAHRPRHRGGRILRPGRRWLAPCNRHR